MRGVVMENNPLSKRGTSQKLENKEQEISAVERSLATVVDQYMFVDQSVRPIKVCLCLCVISPRTHCIEFSQRSLPLDRLGCSKFSRTSRTRL